MQRQTAGAGIGHSYSPPHPLIFHSALAICTAFSILARGYGFGLEDQNLYLPFLLKWNTPGLFPHDYLLQMAYAKESVTWVLLGWLARGIGLRVLFGVTYFTANYMVLLLTHKTATLWWEDVRAGWIAVFLWMPTYAVPGVCNDTFDNYLATRIFGTVMGLLALYGFFRRRDGLSFSAIAGGAFFHVISIVPVFVGILCAHIYRRRWKACLFTTAAVILPVGFLKVFFVPHGAPHILFSRYSGEWLAIVHQTNAGLFPALWAPAAWVALALLLACFVAIFAFRFLHGQCTPHEIDAAVICGGIIVLAALAFVGTVWASTLAVQLSLFRGFVFVMYLLTLYLAGPLASLLGATGVLRAGAAALVISLWLSRDARLQFLAVVLLLLALHLPARISLGSFLAKHRTKILAAVLCACLAYLGRWLHFIPPFPDIPYFPFFAPLFTVIFIMASYVLSRRWISCLHYWMWPLLFACLALIAPTPPIVDLIMKSKVLRRLAGPETIRTVYRPEWEKPSQLSPPNMEEVGALVRGHVPVASTVIVPPLMFSFRVYSLRGSFVTFKDRGPCAYSPVFASEWYSRMLAIKAIQQNRNRGETSWGIDDSLNLRPEEVLSIRDHYRLANVEFILTRRIYPFESLGEAGGFTLYKLPEHQH